ncbi:hypothetical protein [Candidatus Lariskella endosymbiont of Hedychridium roseum]
MVFCTKYRYRVLTVLITYIY